MTFKELRKLLSDFHLFRTEADGWRAAKELAEKEMANRIRKWGLNSSDEELDQISRLQLKVQILPTKILDMEAVEAEREQELRGGTHAFISKTLSKLIGDKQRAAFDYLRDKLVDVLDVQDEHALRNAIDKTTPMQQLNQWSASASIDSGFKFPQASDYAAAMLDVYAKVEAYDFRKVK